LAGLAEEVWQNFTVVPDIRSTGVRNGQRVYEWPVIIRAINTIDAIEASVYKVDWHVLDVVRDRILNEVPGVCRVLFDLTPKPPATIEWE
jgi:GMP synthase (glutamine-hydrolysing)